MKHSLLKLIIASLALFPTFIDTDALTLEDAVLDNNKPQPINPIIPSSDGKTYYRLTDNKKIEKIDYRSGKVELVIFNSDNARNCTIKNWSGFIMSPDESKILLYTNKKSIYRYSFKADYYIFEIKRNNLKRLSVSGQEEIPKFSPDGRMVGFVRDNNIYLKKLDFDSEVAVTTNGLKNSIINGVPDWVYQEEFNLLSSLTFSSDSQMLSYIQWNESDVNTYDLQMYEGACNPRKEYALYPGTFTYKYPKSGTNNSKVSVYSYDIDNRKTKKINLPISNEDYIPKIEFTPAINSLMVMTINRNQNKLQIYNVNPRSTIAKLVYTDTSKSWINIEDVTSMTKFYSSFFVIPSERSGYNQLYKYSSTGSLIEQITKGNETVTDFYGFDAHTNTYYFQRTDGPLNRVISKLDSKKVISNISSQKGWNIADFNTDFNYYIVNYSSAKIPNEYTLWSNNKKIRNLELNEKYKAHLEGDVPLKEFITCTSNGVTLNGYIIKPLDFNTNKKYPVIMSQYSGPGSQQVKNSWKLDWEQYVATQGFIVACFDGRGTGGRGKDFESVVYMQLGKFESIDQVAASEYIASLPYVDKNKIGIFGWSYGGYETLMAMSQENSIYKSGVAIAPVTDWKFYDSIYTERYMRTPNENKSGYDNSSAINCIPKHKGDLLIIAGTADDNVHITNTYQYVANMTSNNKLCDMMIYPNMNHSINYCNVRYPLFSKVIDFFNKTLK